MFCQGCGAEAPPRAAACHVCGRSLPVAADSYRWNEPPVTPAAIVPLVSSPVPVVAATPLAGVDRGDLDTFGLPKDWAGRAVILAALAMAANLLTPWATLGQRHVSAAQYGAPAIALLTTFAMAMVPVLHPSLRRQTLYAVIPLLVGAFCLGIGALGWVYLFYMSATLARETIPFVESADVGLYLFMVGSGALIALGYHLFLAAATARAAFGDDMFKTPPPPPATKPSSAIVTADTPGDTLQMLGASADAGHPHDTAAATVSPPLVQPPVDGTEPGLSVVLPGSAEWSRTPEPPALQRLSTGWRRGARR